jgi:hypothetical protein
MRSPTAGLVLAALFLPAHAAPALADEACTGAVKAAFAKQAEAPRMRTVMNHAGGEGSVTRTINLIRPDRLHMITEAPHEEAGRLETISIGKWAWGAESDGSWTEHKPNVAQMIQLDVQRMSAAPEVSANFSCLGKVAFEGKDYIGYRADPGKGEDGVELAATIYVSEASGLPELNVVAPTTGEGPPRLKAVYSYGDDIAVEAPAGFAMPAEKSRDAQTPDPAAGAKE